jgi:hypothetical protein
VDSRIREIGRAKTMAQASFTVETDQAGTATEMSPDLPVAIDRARNDSAERKEWRAHVLVCIVVLTSCTQFNTSTPDVGADFGRDSEMGRFVDRDGGDLQDASAATIGSGSQGGNGSVDAPMGTSARWDAHVEGPSNSPGSADAGVGCGTAGTSCSGDSLRTCGADGKEVVVTCPYGCNPLNLACKCKPNGSACTGGTMTVCRPDGSGSDQIPCGTLGCNSTTGRCNGCMPGAVVCVDDVIRECSASGELVDRQRCSAGCTPGNTVCNVCRPGTSACNGDSVQTCKPDGSGTNDRVCSGNFACVDAMCSRDTCKTGFKFCPATSVCIPNGGCCTSNDCKACFKCSGAKCVAQSSTEDLKGECDDAPCRTGFCDGRGGCGASPDGKPGPGCTTPGICETNRTDSRAPDTCQGGRCIPGAACDYHGCTNDKTSCASTCPPGSRDFDMQCHACGGSGQLCCQGTPSCTRVDLICSTHLIDPTLSTCEPCGAKAGDPCCENRRCNTSLVCATDIAGSNCRPASNCAPGDGGPCCGGPGMCAGICEGGPAGLVCGSP